MSELKKLISDTLKTSMRAKEKERVTIVRSIQAEIKRVEVDERIEVEDDRVLAILDKMVKQRKDSFQQFTDGGREDLAEIEKKEMDVIAEFLPQQLTEEEVTDIVKAAIAELGELSLWQVRMKPGKPLAYGRVGNTPLIGLPGNPVSAFVTFALFGMPYVRAMQGCNQHFPTPLRVRYPQAITQPLRRREFVRVRPIQAEDKLPLVAIFPRQGSDVLSSTVWADGVVEIPEDTVLPVNSVLNYWSFAALLG